ncbi:class I SAM-dependent methyltransferase [Lutibacter sp.]
MATNTDWFVSWFDTSYYHILYKDRDDTEAQEFMKNLTSFLKLKKGAKLLDLACGRGRHSVYLNSLGYSVIGADLSKNSIQYAKQFENKSLTFIEHDMRNAFEQKFDAILNLFTSFGYFEDSRDDIKVLNNIKNGLNSEGCAVIDFMNVKKVKENLVPHELKVVDNIRFDIKRSFKNGFIVKEIRFFADGKDHFYVEKVKFLDLARIKSYLNEVGFSIKHIFGNYQLANFSEETSDRLILVLE